MIFVYRSDETSTGSVSDTSENEYGRGSSVCPLALLSKPCPYSIKELVQEQFELPNCCSSSDPDCGPCDFSRVGCFELDENISRHDRHIDLVFRSSRDFRPFRRRGQKGGHCQLCGSRWQAEEIFLRWQR